MHPSRIPFTVCCLALAAALASAGCGGASNKSSTSGNSGGLSKAALAAKANAICASANAAAPKQPADIATNPLSAAAYLDKLIGVAGPAVNRIAALQPPSSLRGEVDSYLSSVRRELSLIRTADRKAHASDPTGLSDLQQAAAAGSDARTKAAGLGWTGCTVV